MGLKIVGYITSDALKLGYVSHQNQNQTIKGFVENQQHQFLLSWTEYKGKASFILRSLLLENFYEGICFYSIEQVGSGIEANLMIERLVASGLWIGFARELVHFHGSVGAEEVRRLCWLKNQFEKSRPELDALWAN